MVFELLSSMVKLSLPVVGTAGSLFRQVNMVALRRLERPKTDISLWELLRWSYLRQQVIAETGRSLEVAESFLDGELTRNRTTTDGTVSMMRLGVVGTRVDGKGADALAARVHPDAALMHDLVCMLPVQLRRTLVEAVLSDTVPEPYSGPIEWRAVPSSDPGRYRYETDGNWYVIPKPRTYAKTAGKTMLRQNGYLIELFDDCARLYAPFCLVVQVPDAGVIQRSKQAAREFNAAVESLLFLIEGTVFERYEVVEAGV